MENYQYEENFVKIRADDSKGGIDICTNCKNFTIREALQHTFNQRFVINSHFTETEQICSRFSIRVDLN